MSEAARADAIDAAQAYIMSLKSQIAELVDQREDVDGYLRFIGELKAEIVTLRATVAAQAERIGWLLDEKGGAAHGREYVEALEQRVAAAEARVRVLVDEIERLRAIEAAAKAVMGAANHGSSDAVDDAIDDLEAAPCHHHWHPTSNRARTTHICCFCGATRSMIGMPPEYYDQEVNCGDYLRNYSV